MQNSYESIIGSLCKIYVTKANGQQGMGQGGFIGPDRVLTACHVLEDAVKAMFVRRDGAYAYMKRGSVPKKSPKELLDVEVVQLEAPIGTSFCNPITSDQHAEDISKGFLVTHFNVEPEIHPLEVDRELTKNSCEDPDISKNLE